MIDTAMMEQIPLIDTHVHRFHPNRAGDFSTVAGGYIQGPDQKAHAKQTLLYGMVVEALRVKFGMPEDVLPEQVVEERQRRYLADPFAYARFLLDDQNVSLYCLEIGSPFAGKAYTPQEIADFHTVIPKEKTCSIVRIERVLEDLRPQRDDYRGFITAYEEELRKRIQEERTIALKSMCAYTGGLDVRIVTDQEAQKAFDLLRREPENAAAKKILRDHILMVSAEIAGELGLPIQIHTGAGGGTWLDYRTQNPIHLIDFLKDPRILNRVRIVLLHGGHPHEEDAGYLASQFSNVYTDFSGSFYLCSAKAPERMVALMEKCPLDKIMYGSDGVGMPELSWFAHQHFRKLLPKVLNGLTADGFMTARRAQDVARMFCYENARACYEKINQYL